MSLLLALFGSRHLFDFNINTASENCCCDKKSYDIRISKDEEKEQKDFQTGAKCDFSLFQTHGIFAASHEQRYI